MKNTDIKNCSDKKDLQNRNTQLAGAVTHGSFAGTDDPNVAQWRLQTDDILDKAEHFLKGDIIKEDGEGNVKFVAQTNQATCKKQFVSRFWYVHLWGQN